MSDSRRMGWHAALDPRNKGGGSRPAISSQGYNKKGSARYYRGTSAAGTHNSKGSPIARLQQDGDIEMKLLNTNKEGPHSNDHANQWLLQRLKISVGDRASAYSFPLTQYAITEIFSAPMCGAILASACLFVGYLVIGTPHYIVEFSILMANIACNVAFALWMRYLTDTELTRVITHRLSHLVFGVKSRREILEEKRPNAANLVTAIRDKKKIMLPANLLTESGCIAGSYSSHRKFHLRAVKIHSFPAPIYGDHIRLGPGDIVPVNVEPISIVGNSTAADEKKTANIKKRASSSQKDQRNAIKLEEEVEGGKKDVDSKLMENTSSNQSPTVIIRNSNDSSWRIAAEEDLSKEDKVDGGSGGAAAKGVNRDGDHKNGQNKFKKEDMTTTLGLIEAKQQQQKDNSERHISSRDHKLSNDNNNNNNIKSSNETTTSRISSQGHSSYAKNTVQNQQPQQLKKGQIITPENAGY
eukprot:jgi/Bigna1/67754/fgenesh1_pg.4_\